MQRLHLLGASVEIFAHCDSFLAPSPAIAAAGTEILHCHLELLRCLGIEPGRLYRLFADLSPCLPLKVAFSFDGRGLTGLWP
jgi:hypothetical protein